MKLRTRDRLKLVTDTVLFGSLLIAALTGILKMPVLSDGLSDELYDHYQDLPWEILNFLHDWSGALVIACVVVHLALVWRRYLWLLRHASRQDE
jgi:cytochrome bd-type quinol oxidase subunit 2